MKLHLVILQNIITLNPQDIAIAMSVRHNCVAVDRQYSEQSEVNRELKQQRQRRLRKRHLKVNLRSSNYVAPIPFRSVRQMLAIF